jgi:hypothetical protein
MVACAADKYYEITKQVLAGAGYSHDRNTNRIVPKTSNTNKSRNGAFHGENDMFSIKKDPYMGGTRIY